MRKPKILLALYRYFRRKEIKCTDDLCKMLSYQMKADNIRKHLKKREATNDNR